MTQKEAGAVSSGLWIGDPGSHFRDVGLSRFLPGGKVGRLLWTVGRHGQAVGR